MGAGAGDKQTAHLIGRTVGANGDIHGLELNLSLVGEGRGDKGMGKGLLRRAGAQPVKRAEHHRHIADERIVGPSGKGA